MTSNTRPTSSEHQRQESKLCLQACCLAGDPYLTGSLAGMPVVMGRLARGFLEGRAEGGIGFIAYRIGDSKDDVGRRS